MAESGPTAPRTAARTKRLLTALGLLLFLGLVCGAAATDGVGGALLMVGLAIVLVGGAALVRGRARWAHVDSRRIGLMVALGGLGLFLVGGALVPTQSTPAASRLALGTATTPPSSTQAASLLTTAQTASSTPAPPTTSAPPVTTSEPASTAPAPVVVTTTHAPPPNTYAPPPRTQQPAPPAAVAPPVVAAPPPSSPVASGSLGTAPIQKPPSGNFYRAGEYCPAVDAGKTTQDASGRSLICTNNNGLRWEYA